MIAAVYNGDGNFAGSQSQGQQNATVVGDKLSITNLDVGEPINAGQGWIVLTNVDGNVEEDLPAGNVATVSGNAYNRDGGAFTVAVNRGDGSQPFLKDISDVPCSSPAAVIPPPEPLQDSPPAYYLSIRSISSPRSLGENALEIDTQPPHQR